MPPRVVRARTPLSRIQLGHFLRLNSAAVPTSFSQPCKTKRKLEMSRRSDGSTVSSLTLGRGLSHAPGLAVGRFHRPHRGSRACL